MEDVNQDFRQFTNARWRRLLTAEQFRVTREGGTERPYSGQYWNVSMTGTYLCACCGLPVYSSDAKYDSGTGWPSFHEPIDDAAVETVVDRKFGIERIAARCARCGAHLGHVFDDGPPPTGKRHSINSAALKLVPTEQV